MKHVTVVATELVDAGDWLAMSEVCRACSLERAAVDELGELGFIAPREVAPGQWRLPAAALPHLRVVGRLMHDLGVNASGAALAVELLETQRALERRLRALERLVSGEG